MAVQLRIAPMLAIVRAIEYVYFIMDPPFQSPLREPMTYTQKSVSSETLRWRHGSKAVALGITVCRAAGEFI